MKDRQPATGKGGRVSITLDSATVSTGTLNLTDSTGAITGIFAHADSATVAGSAYNKANVLPSAVTAALGLTDATAEPKDAFTALNNKITAANTNIATLTNITSGNYTQVATSDHNTNPDAAPDWRSVTTAKTDFLITTTAVVSASGRTLNIAVGSVVFSKSLSAGTTTLKPRIWKSGNVWFCQWESGAILWAWVVAGETSVTIKAYLNTQSVVNGNVVQALTVYGR